jgi:hypothetical protein
MATGDEIAQAIRERFRKLKADDSLGDKLLRFGAELENAGIIPNGTVEQHIPAVVKAVEKAGRVERAINILLGD